MSTIPPPNPIDRVRVVVEQLRRVEADPAWRDRLTPTDLALLALANLVDQAITAIDGQAMREMTGLQIFLLRDLRAAVPPREVKS